MANKSDKVVVKKIRPYPFNATVEAGAEKLLTKVFLINLRGLIIETGKQMVSVGRTYQVTLELPGSKAIVIQPVKVVRTFDRFLKDGSGKPPALALSEDSPAAAPGPAAKGAIVKRALTVQRMAELHFLKLSSDSEHQIQKFMTAIRQA